MLSAADLAKIVNKNGGNLLDKIDIEDIYNYLRLKAALQSTDVSEDEAFQERYRQMYKIQGVGVSKAFLQRYFEVLEQSKASEEFDFRAVSQELFGVNPRRKLSSSQFAFLSKMANLVNSAYPIYDNYVADMFDFDKPTQTRLSSRERLNAYLAFYAYMTETYQQLLDEDMLHDTLVVFKILLKKYRNEEFPTVTLPYMKRIDYLVEAAAHMQNKLITA
ncbi:MAG: hypothetical protein D6722_29575 [Bacteroidetes bacterium]|nr:MAG: hypothetical protein D6722_29575 [Bacteroidota bacterium]